MEFKSFIKLILPFTIGVLVGAGFTRNKYALYIIICYIIFMILIQFLGNKIKNVTKSHNKKDAIIDATFDTLDTASDYTKRGNDLGKNWFDRHYSTYAFMFNIGLLLMMLGLLYYGKYIYAVIIFVTLHIHIILNQIWRRIKVNEAIKDGNT